MEDEKKDVNSESSTEQKANDSQKSDASSESLQEELQKLKETVGNLSNALREERFKTKKLKAYSFEKKEEEEGKQEIDEELLERKVSEIAEKKLQEREAAFVNQIQEEAFIDFVKESNIDVGSDLSKKIEEEFYALREVAIRKGTIRSKEDIKRLLKTAEYTVAPELVENRLQNKVAVEKSKREKESQDADAGGTSTAPNTTVNKATPFDKEAAKLAGMSVENYLKFKRI